MCALSSGGVLRVSMWVLRGVCVPRVCGVLRVCVGAACGPWEMPLSSPRPRPRLPREQSLPLSAWCRRPGPWSPCFEDPCP